MFGNTGMFKFYIKVDFISVVLHQQLPHDNTKFQD